MTVGKRFCGICGKEKEIKKTTFGDLSFYIECECEKLLREAKEKDDEIYARKTALEIRNRSSHLSLTGRKSSFETADIDENNDMAIRGGKFLLNQMLHGDCCDGKFGLVLQGNRGSGKTYIGCAIINDYNNAMPITDLQKKRIISERDNFFSINEFTPINSACKFITEMDLFSLYYDNFNYAKVDSPVAEFKNAAKLLVVDDVGSSNYDKKRIQAMYFNIIDYRYSEQLPILLTSNLNKNELSDYLGERTFDRLVSCCYFLDLTAPKSRR